MNDEVKQAIERLFEDSYGDDEENEVTVDGQHFDDLVTLSSAYIAEHTNDAENALPLSAEILQASGWWCDATDDDDPERWIHDKCGFTLWCGIHEWRIESNGSDFASLFTVGDLRRLLEALHIDAVITVPNGGE